MREITVKYQGECRKCGATLAVGDVVDCGMYAPGKILKINKKTAKIEGRFGDYNVDLAFLSPVRKEN